MRILFFTGGGRATVHALLPLASACRTEGHEVIVAAPQEDVAAVTEHGLPAFAMSEMGVFKAMFWDRDGNKLDRPRGEAAECEFASRGFARMAADSFERVADLADHWRPDLVVGGTRNYGAALIAHHAKVPYVCQAWDALERDPQDLEYVADELRPELEKLGLDTFPREDLYVHITPASLRPEGAEPAQYMRWTPGSTQLPLEPWVYRRTERKRVLVTSGSRAAMIDTLGVAFFRPVLENPVFQDVELIVATQEPVAEALRAEWPGIRAGYVPLDTVVPSCDLLIHHGGGQTCMYAAAAGVPQLVFPDMLASAIPMRRFDAYGASITLNLVEPPERIEEAGRAILTDPSYRERARALAEEIAALPSTSAIVRKLEELAGR
ncbi:glycosyltransferase [Streptomyces sp. NPDC014861]|uniref:glycosyltransferase n=1 Tax=Streptomyces sp. NPDC014861 TaxID=3364923 RepID=UPI0036F8EB84